MQKSTSQGQPLQDDGRGENAADSRSGSAGLRQAPEVPNTLLFKALPRAALPYALLMRLDKPIGESILEGLIPLLITAF